MFKIIFLFLLVVSSQFIWAAECKEVISNRVDERTWVDLFLDNYKKFDFSKSPLTLGIEVEAIVPEKFEYSQLAKIVQKEIQKTYPGSEVIRTNNWIMYTKKGFKYEYRIVSEPSIDAPSKKQDMELISPILRDQEDIEVFFRVVKRLRKKGMKSYPNSAGVHIHIGFPDGRVEEIAILTKLFSGIEKQVYQTFSVSGSRKHWSARWTEKELKDLLAMPNMNGLTIENILLAAGSRNKGLNLLALRSKGTVEFRLFNSTVDIQQIQLMINFAETLVRAVREKDPRLVKFLKDHQNKEEFPFDELVLALDLKLGKEKDVIERMHREIHRAIHQERRWEEKAKVPNKKLRKLSVFAAILLWVYYLGYFLDFLI